MIVVHRVSGPEAWAFIRAAVEKFHRHHAAPQGWKWGYVATNRGRVVGVATIGRAVGRWGRPMLELTRGCTWSRARFGAASAMLGAAARSKCRGSAVQAVTGAQRSDRIKGRQLGVEALMAFEHKIAKSRPMEIVGVPATTWQAGWLGLGSAAGRPTLKKASDLAAQHFFGQAGVPDSVGRSISGDAADAVNINLWWLDHHLSGLPRLFASKTSKARTRARTKP